VRLQFHAFTLLE